MAKMIDLGHMESEDMAVPTKAKRKKYYPTVYLDAGVPLPLKPTDVGKDFNITGKIHITGIDESTTENRKKKEFRFELRSMAIQRNKRTQLKDALKNARG